MNTKEAANYIFRQLGKEIRLATPLGLGKPNHLLNEIYQVVKNTPSLNLKIYTALSLTPPSASSSLEKKFLDPFKSKFWGDDYPILEYAKDSTHDKLPPNIKVHEFYFQAGAALHSETLQRDYQSINYTHVVEAVFQAKVNVLVQMIAQRTLNGKTQYSLACNPDLSLDLVDYYKANSRPLLVIGVIHPELPFLEGEAVVPQNFFNLIVDDSPTYKLFALPRVPIDKVDHAIGFHTSQLVVDNGTIQIGIGSLSEAVVSSLIMRQNKNKLYKKLLDLNPTSKILNPRQTSPFSLGLYGLSEMITDGFMHLRKAGILKRMVVDEKSKTQTYLHGAFFLGSQEFYHWLRDLNQEDFSGIRMGRVSKVNDLYDPHEITLRIQRINPRFINTCMKATLLGEASSETLQDGRVVSGVGGQYNFVAMSQELKNSRSILMLRSTKIVKGKRKSNIVWTQGHLTIPRHLRDIFVTEYGIADTKGKSDEEVIKAMLNIADSQFQEELLDIAKKNKKIDQNYQIPRWAKNNTPIHLSQFINQGKTEGVFNSFPLGSDFTQAEENLSVALNLLKEKISTFSGIPWLIKAFLNPTRKNKLRFQKELERMELIKPTLKNKFYQCLLLRALQETIG